MAQRPRAGDMLRTVSHTYIYNDIESVMYIPPQDSIMRVGEYVVCLHAVAIRSSIGMLSEVITSSGRRGFIAEDDLQVV